MLGESKQSQTDTMKLRPEMDVGQNLPGKPRSCGDTQITRYGLKQNMRVSQEEARYNGPGSV